MPETFCVKLAGPAGYGVMSAGEILIHSLIKMGYYALGYPEYPSLIKGGHNIFLITLSNKPNPNNSESINLLVALAQTALDHEHNNITQETNVVCDISLKVDHTIKNLSQPDFIGAAKQAGNPLTLNTVALGFISHQLKITPDIIWGFIKSELGSKSDELLNQNQMAFENGRKLSEKYHLNINLPAANNKSSRLCLNGSQATGLGAIAAGINLFAGYPMTPSSPLLHFMAANQEKFNYLVRQTEDEICAINTVVGASFAGAKSMTGTSGGGFALMNEGLSLAAMLETPVVIYLAMRPAPATGLPTWTSQSDLLFAINAAHGEFPRIVLAPADPRECYLLAHQAFTLSQRYHIPVIILSDKYLAENFYCLENLPKLEPVPLSFTTTENNGEIYPRYQYTLNGVHPRTLPGIVGGEYIANSDEHNAFGLVDESAENRNSNNNRRELKIKEISKNIPQPEVTGSADTAVISWGSHKYIAGEVAEKLNFAHIHFSYLWPLPPDLKMLLENYHRLIVIENNTTHQLARLIRMETGIDAQTKLGEDAGRPLSVESLIKQIKNES